MSLPTPVINVKDAPKGWRDDPSFVDVRRMRNGRVCQVPGKPGYFGNPYKISETMSRDEAVETFRYWAAKRVKEDPEYKAAVIALEGKTLVCCCAPLRCHGEVLSIFARMLAGSASRTTVDKGGAH